MLVAESFIGITLEFVRYTYYIAYIDVAGRIYTMRFHREEKKKQHYAVLYRILRQYENMPIVSLQVSTLQSKSYFTYKKSSKTVKEFVF